MSLPANGFYGLYNRLSALWSDTLFLYSLCLSSNKSLDTAQLPSARWLCYSGRDAEAGEELSGLPVIIGKEWSWLISPIQIELACVLLSTVQHDGNSKRRASELLSFQRLKTRDFQCTTNMCRPASIPKHESHCLGAGLVGGLLSNRPYAPTVQTWHSTTKP